jgi:hypothetical protein
VYNPYDPARIIGLILGVMFFLSLVVIAVWLFVNICRAVLRLLGLLFGFTSRPGGRRRRREKTIIETMGGPTPFGSKSG